MRTAKVVIDTNVLVSGILFGGAPYRVLKAWEEGKITIAVSEEIVGEYRRVLDTLSKKVGGMSFDGILEAVLMNANVVASYSLGKGMCDDPDDDKFIACAVASRSSHIITGDKHLLKIERFAGIEILTPRQFLDGKL